MTRNKISFSIALLICGISSAAGQSVPDSSRVVSLRECLELSRNGGVECMNAELDLKAAKARRQEALSLYFPNVSAVGFGFHTLDPLAKISLGDVLGGSEMAANLNSFLTTAASLAGIESSYSFLSNGYLASLNVVQPVFAGGRIVNGNSLASLGVEAASIRRNMVQRDSDDSIERKYWTAVSLSDKKKVLEQTLGFLSALEKDVEAAERAGIVGEGDLIQVSIKKKQLESKFLQLRGGEKLAKMDLFNSIRLPYTFFGLDSLVLEDVLCISDSLRPPVEYYRNEDEVAASLDEARLLQLNVDAKRLEKKMAMGEALPSVGVGGFLTYYKMIGDPMRNGGVFATVSIPLSDWGKTARKMERLQCEVDKARNEQTYLDSQLALRVRKEWLDLQTAWDSYCILREELGLSELLEKQKKASYDAGVCTMSELLQAQAELEGARTALVDAAIAYRTALGVWIK